MTIVVSTSSPIVSAALFSPDGELIATDRMESRQNASGAALSIVRRLLSENAYGWSDCHRVVADLGPGSFMGSKVAVTIVKTLGTVLCADVYGVTSFDLIDCKRDAYVPSKKGEFFFRPFGCQPEVATSVPIGAVGYGLEYRESRFPLAENLCPQCALSLTKPEALVPLYIAPPSISVPKDPTVTGGKHE